MDARGFREFIDGLVRKAHSGAVLNYFVAKRIYASRRFNRVKLKSLEGNTSIKKVRKEFDRKWLVLGAGTDPSDPNRPRYTACVKIGEIPSNRFKVAGGSRGTVSVDLTGSIEWTEGEKSITYVIRKQRSLRMTEEQKAKRFIECVLAQAHCSEEEAMELWASTKSATLSKLRKKLSEK
ncbi:MAG: hypothetical protein JRI70_00470 [Deltaproteobacteria bacterium]|nr:hypothetical protein [Deltaproteobacteria bacterium]MBW2171176.1 hypothetical protein [Deltaproteobacteria bacterium]